MTMKLEAVPDDGNSPVAATPEPDWRDSLPESVREWQEVADAKTPDDFYKQMGEIRSHVGSSIRIPGEDASDDDRQAFYQKLVDKKIGVMPIPNQEDEAAMGTLYQQLGRPGEAGDYKVPEIEGLDPNDTNVAQFKGYAHAAGLNQKQFLALIEPMVQATQTAKSEAAAAHSADLAALHGEWGLKYDQNVSSVRKLLEASQAPDSVLSAMDADNMTAGELKWLQGLASQMGSEGNPIGSQGNAGSGVLAPAEAAAQIAEIMNNSDHPFHHPNKPGYAEAQVKMRTLWQEKLGADNEIITTIGSG